ncbi:MAG: phosphatase PAP2 family protein, partial [Limisphaerales bacterium]
HSSVFPSAHVSSAFSAAWGLLAYLPERKRFGILMLVYAVSVAIATIYGRYHYAVDALAGLGVSLVAGLMTILLVRHPLRLRGLPSQP